MEWDVQSKTSNLTSKPEVSVSSTEGMPPLTDITVKHKVVSKRRSRAGSLNAHHGASDVVYRDNSTAMMPPLTRIRKTPIAGGSWDDNSVGHGSVAARMRRERNRAIMRTQSTATNPLYHSVDTHEGGVWRQNDAPANVTSTLNLINTTALSPLPSERDRYHDINETIRYPWETHRHNYHSAATKGAAGSMFNIPVTGHHHQSSQQPWDTHSIPEIHSTASCDRTCHRSYHRHSYSSGLANNSYLHSSPTSGCASIASSDLDSADFMYFSINDDSSYFDGDSLFAESLGMMGDNEGDAAFSTNILSLLEEGSISCRTPFPASDWPDSISELDFDCSEGKSEDVTNCDALSDIGPSCSSPPQRRRMTKRQSMNQNKTSEAEPNDSDSQGDIMSEENGGDVKTVINFNDRASDAARSSTSDLTLQDNEGSSHSQQHDDKRIEYIEKINATMMKLLSPQEQNEIIQIIDPNKSGTPFRDFHISSERLDSMKLASVLKYLEDKSHEKIVPDIGGDSRKKQRRKSKGGSKSVDEDPGVVQHGVEKENVIEMTTHNIAEAVKTKHRDLPKPKFDEVVAVTTRFRPGSRQETSSNGGKESKHLESCNDSSCKGCASNLRRSNSEGNIPKSAASETQKEYRRQQRQARRWAKWLKTRQRKENRQLMKEHRSGLFMKEKKVKLKTESEEIDVEIG